MGPCPSVMAGTSKTWLALIQGGKLSLFWLSLVEEGDPQDRGSCISTDKSSNSFISIASSHGDTPQDCADPLHIVFTEPLCWHRWVTPLGYTGRVSILSISQVHFIFLTLSMSFKLCFLLTCLPCPPHVLTVHPLPCFPSFLPLDWLPLQPTTFMSFLKTSPLLPPVWVCPSASTSAGFCPFLFPHPQSVSPWLPDLDLSCVSILITRNLETHLQSRACSGVQPSGHPCFTPLLPQEAGMGFSGPLLGRKNGRVLAHRINLKHTEYVTLSPSPQEERWRTKKAPFMLWGRHWTRETSECLTEFCVVGMTLPHKGRESEGQGG